MNSSLADQLDEAISALLAGGKTAPHWVREIHQLLPIADDLWYLPRPEFRASLRDQLLQRAGNHVFGALAQAAQRKAATRPESVVPPLFITESGAFPVRGSHLALSFALHVAALALVVASGWWMVENHAVVRNTMAQLIATDNYSLPPAPTTASGGGGGGDNDKMPASRGSAPRFATPQLTPPTAIIRNESPILPAEPTVVGPPEAVLPEFPRAGDPMADVSGPPSNGTGTGGGIGSGRGGGVGSGEGPGVGAGRGGRTGGGVYRLGGGILAPRAIYAPDPEFSEEARKAKYQGSVILSAIIGSDGRPRDLRVVRSSGMGLDEKATEAAARWRFEPAHMGNQPVAVQVNIEVVFRLY
jgi:protein TonB